MKAKTILFAAAAAASLGIFAADFKPADVLVYTRWDYVKNQKTGEVAKGGTAPWAKPYHHESTEQGAEEVRRYFTANGYKCLVTDDPAVFVSDAMKSFKLVMLCNTNHELFDTDAQREAFYKFVETAAGLSRRTARARTSAAQSASATSSAACSSATTPRTRKSPSPTWTARIPRWHAWTRATCGPTTKSTSTIPPITCAPS